MQKVFHQLISITDAAKLLGFSVPDLKEMIRSGSGPNAVKQGTRVVGLIHSDVAAWQEFMAEIRDAFKAQGEAERLSYHEGDPNKPMIDGNPAIGVTVTVEKEDGEEQK